MFNVKVGDTEYHVGFDYFDEVTKCTIFLKENHDSDLVLSLIGVGFSVCKHPDVFNKNVVRKKALKRVMDYIGMGRDTRTIFWNKYWEKRGKID